MTTRWTVLVYMVADTGEGFYQNAMEDVTEMMRAQFDERVRVVVHADAPSQWDTKCWEVTGAPEGKIGEAKPIDSYGTGLLDFAQKSVDRYESEYYLLVLWGHGEGIDWKEKVLAGRPPSSAIVGAGKRFAPGSQGVIEVGELGKALAELRLGKKENIVVGFDACLMGMVEVYDEIQKYVGWVVAANDEIPVTGWPYTHILNFLGADPEKKPMDLAEKIADICADWYSENDPESKVSFAACDLSKGDALREATAHLADELETHIRNIAVRDAVVRARNFAEDLQEIAYVDLNAFCSELRKQTAPMKHEALDNAADSVMKTLRDYSKNPQFSSNYPYAYAQDSRAVSICFPSADSVGSIPNLRINWGSYKDLTFTRATHWYSFLTKFWDRRQARAAGQG
jgi:Clostripain family